MITDKQIIAGNRLIFDSPFHSTEYEREEHPNPFYSQILKYHISWDALMPVWTKIKYVGADLGTVFKPYWDKFHLGVDTDIMKSWEAVVEFFTWYNK